MLGTRGMIQSSQLMLLSQECIFMADLLKVQENIAEAAVIWTAFPLGCQSYFSQEYRIICKKKNARFVFLFRTNTANLSAPCLSYGVASTKANCHTRSLLRRSRGSAVRKRVPSQDTENSKTLSDTGSHSRCVGCQDVLFIQSIPFFWGAVTTVLSVFLWRRELHRRD